MSLLVVMLPMMLGFALMRLALLLWAVRNGQFEDLEGEKHRILFDNPDYLEREMGSKPVAPKPAGR